MVEENSENKAGGESHYCLNPTNSLSRIVETMKIFIYTNDGKQHDETKLSEMSNANNALIFVKRRQ